jgi:hypothetical protein
MLKLNWLDLLGDRNPQLLRELKGRLKPRNVILAVALSILGQFLLWVSFLLRVPHPTTDLTIYKGGFPISDLYCTGSIDYGNNRKCLVDAVGDLLVDWQKWSLDLFLVLSLIGIFGLLLAGTYLLIDNLAYEERKGTLNFIRLTPRSPQSILWGKLLGVPSLLYLVVLLAVPLHLWAGFAAHIPLLRILSFYGLLGMSCVFFYSLSLLFGLISSSALSGFQAWLGSGTVFLFILVGLNKPLLGNALDWLNIFSPALVLQYLIASTGIDPVISYAYLNIPKLYWFGLPAGAGIGGVASLLILNYSLWTYWSWRAMERCYPNPSKTIFSKPQSYLLVACFEMMALGFARFSDRYGLTENFKILLAYNFVLFFGLIITLTPQRQTVIDWARYRKQKSFSKGLFNLSLLKDLVWGENNPPIVAIALNLAITAVILVPWIILASDNSTNLSASIALVLSLSLIALCAALAQLVVFIQTQKPGLWVIGTLGAVIILPPLLLGLLGVNAYTSPTLWLFTVFAFEASKTAGMFNVLLAVLGQLSLLTLCSWQITHQLKKAGASNSLTLLASRSSIKPH